MPKTSCRENTGKSSTGGSRLCVKVTPDCYCCIKRSTDCRANPFNGQQMFIHKRCHKKPRRSGVFLERLWAGTINQHAMLYLIKDNRGLITWCREEARVP